MGTIQSVVAMPGAVFTGWIYDQTQSYTYAVIPFIFIYALAGLALWQAPRPRKPQSLGLDIPAGHAMDIQPSRP
jgi:cyanate permease